MAIEISSNSTHRKSDRRFRIGRIDPVKRSATANAPSIRERSKELVTRTSRRGEFGAREASAEKRRADARPRDRSPAYICSCAPGYILIGEDPRGTLRRLAHRAGGSTTCDERCRVLRSDVATTPFCDWYRALLSASAPSSLLIAAP